jgi:hypothetical protein
MGTNKPNIMKITRLLVGCALATAALSCSKDEHGTITGRWVPEGFENIVRYEFQDGIQYTIYGNGSGEFPSLVEWVQANLDTLQQNCEVKGDFQWAQMEFVRGNDVVRLHQCCMVSQGFSTKLYR